MFKCLTHLLLICKADLLDTTFVIFYNYVKNNSKGGIFMRKVYIDNIRWITVVLVVIYHVIYMFNGVETAGVIGPFAEMQYQDVYQYMVYPWFMLLLFVVSGMCARFCLEGCSDKAFLKKRTQKLLVPSTIGLFVFQWILGYYNMMLWLFSVILVVIRKLEKDRLYSKCEKAPVWLLLLFTIVAYGAWCTTKRKTYLWHGKSRGERTNRDPGKSQKAV